MLDVMCTISQTVVGTFKAQANRKGIESPGSMYELVINII
jgi:hypothetical protein